MMSDVANHGERLTFAVVPRDLDDGTPMIAIVWHPRPLEWIKVWTTAFPTAADRDLVYDEMWLRRARWQDWGQLAVFAGARALNDILLAEIAAI